MGPQLLFPPGVGLVLEQVRLCGEIVHLIACCAADGATCPASGCWSEAPRSQHERHLADPPIAGRRILIDLRVRRSCGKEPKCRRRTFVVEQAPGEGGTRELTTQPSHASVLRRLRPRVRQRGGPGRGWPP